MKIKLAIISAAIFLVVALSFSVFNNQSDIKEVHSVQTSKLQIKTQNTTKTYTIEIADTHEERSKGLMFRENMDLHHGMLFLFEDYAPRRFWMRNTLIALDIIFIDEKGTINDIIHMAQPHDENLRISNAPAKAVLEINGGTAYKQNIKIGDTVIYPSFFTK